MKHNILDMFFFLSIMPVYVICQKQLALEKLISDATI